MTRKELCAAWESQARGLVRAIRFAEAKLRREQTFYNFVTGRAIAKVQRNGEIIFFNSRPPLPTDI